MLSLDNLDLAPSDSHVPTHRLFDAGVLAFHYHVAVGTIYRWVSEDDITAYRAPAGARERRRYDLHDIQRAYDKRHPAPLA